MSRSTWYYNMNALKQVDRHAGLKDKIREIYAWHKGRYGYRRITLSLRKQGLLVTAKTGPGQGAEMAARLMIRATNDRSR